MFVAAHEWTAPREPVASHDLPDHLVPAPNDDKIRELYECLSNRPPDEAAKTKAAAFLNRVLAQAQSDACDLPESPHGLGAWMHNSAQLASVSYRAYLAERKAGKPRLYFQNRSHALYFLRTAAPTKLVDGAWLYGVLAHWRNQRFSNLISTYLEELGDGRPDKNHVHLYRELLARYGLDTADKLPDAFYLQGAVQLALGYNASDFLPEVIGFNLGYEQLPLHLLISAYELNELGIDPYYFTLHITVDNADTGHARRAVQSVLDCLPHEADSAAFWQRVRNGCKLSEAGIGTTQVIASFDIEREVIGIFSRKSVTGHGAHSDYCRVAGRSINDWLACSDNIPAFLAALQQAGWIKRGAPVQQSRFWKLLQGDRAEMFGVFSPYELQLIHDWIRGAASADGQAYSEHPLEADQRRASFRAIARQAGQPYGVSLSQQPRLLDPDLETLRAQVAMSADMTHKKKLLVQAMSPDRHWTPAGLYATRLFRQLAA